MNEPTKTYHVVLSGWYPDYPDTLNEGNIHEVEIPESVPQDWIEHECFEALRMLAAGSILAIYESREKAIQFIQETKEDYKKELL